MQIMHIFGRQPTLRVETASFFGDILAKFAPAPTPA